LRADLSKLGIERVAGQAEPEDHAAILCEIMAGLASGRFPASAGADRELFERHLAPWIGRFFADLERAETADFYRRIGTLGRVFIDIETDAFALPS
jgi:TorA maturation chaperone TorD